VQQDPESIRGAGRQIGIQIQIWRELAKLSTVSSDTSKLFQTDLHYKSDSIKTRAHSACCGSQWPV